MNSISQTLVEIHDNIPAVTTENGIQRKALRNAIELINQIEGLNNQLIHEASYPTIDCDHQHCTHYE